ncbi:MAG: hypothetical protein ACJ8C4_07170 [Gemmataceae bacterium]
MRIEYHSEEFLNRYHKRLNVQSTFSAVKWKFGSHLCSRDRVSIVNESLCKFICNLCCVIKSQLELDVEAELAGI